MTNKDDAAISAAFDAIDAVLDAMSDDDDDDEDDNEEEEYDEEYDAYHTADEDENGEDGYRYEQQEESEPDEPEPEPKPKPKPKPKRRRRDKDDDGNDTPKRGRGRPRKRPVVEEVVVEEETPAKRRLRLARQTLAETEERRNMTRAALDDARKTVEDLEAKLDESRLLLQEKERDDEEASDAVKSASDEVGRAELEVPGKWNDMYRRLVAYVEEHGDTIVPQPAPSDDKDSDMSILGRWVGSQRILYKRFRQAEKDGHGERVIGITAQRVAALDRIGFVWDVNEYKFTKYLSELVEYRDLNGDTNVPPTYPQNQFLSNWVRTQRKEWRRLIAGRPSCLSEGDRVARLDAIGFQWNAPRPWLKESEDGGTVLAIAEGDAAGNEALLSTNPESVRKREYRRRKRREAAEAAAAASGGGDVDEPAAATSASSGGLSMNPTAIYKREWRRARREAAAVFAAATASTSASASAVEDNARRPSISYPAAHSYDPPGAALEPSATSGEAARVMPSPPAAPSGAGADGGADEYWEARFRDMVAFRERHGHCQVRNRGCHYTGIQKLQTWVAQQRKEYAKYADGKPSILSSDRISRLDELEFPWRWRLPSKSGPRRKSSPPSSSMQDGSEPRKRTRDG